MKTDDLVVMLSTNVEPIRHGRVGRTISIAVVVGAVIALAIMLVGLGVRADVTTSRAALFLSLKLAFAFAVVGVALRYLIMLARPGSESGISPLAVAVPFAAIALLGLLSLTDTPSGHWNRMVAGGEWLECLLSIPIIAIVPFAVTIFAVRRAAPTNLVRAGAFAGLVAGGVSAMAYAFHCTDDSLPFVAVWYGGTIVLCTLAGASLGPRLLRW
ncbi:MAG: DUF1109 domain-containing protein [Alphaproteobacteria bacterium]|nr:MAG: DUF1109 domain-containing protein [Alphaproteobacteria bacterium]